jgi:hypothetical protein
VAGVGSGGFCGVNVSGWGAWAVASAARREPAEKWFEEEGKYEGGRVPPCRVARLKSMEGVEPYGVI